MKLSSLTKVHVFFFVISIVLCQHPVVFASVLEHWSDHSNFLDVDNRPEKFDKKPTYLPGLSNMLKCSSLGRYMDVDICPASH